MLRGHDHLCLNKRKDMCQYVSVTRIDIVIVCDITRPQCLPAAPWHLTSVTPESEQSIGERDAGWQWQQGPGPDSYYHSDYNFINFINYLLLLLLLPTTNTNTQEEEDARVWWNHVPYSYPHPAYGENDWRWSLDQWPKQCFFFNFPCKLCINLPYLSGVHGLSQADVDLVIAKAKIVVEGSKAAMVRLTFNDCVGK